MNAVIYARYSSDRQRGESIDGQVRECKAYAEKNEINVVDIYIDRAKSASKDTEKRDNFLRMIKDSAKHLFDVVLVWKQDRFARTRYDHVYYKAILKKNGARVVSATEHISEGPEGIILESVIEGYTEYYSAELSAKIHRGQTENALKAQSNGGRVPFGYMLIDHKLQPDPATAPVALEIFKRYAEGATVREIIEDLNQRGIKTQRGQEFKYSSFTALWKNRTYIGEYHYSDTVIPGGVPAIIPQETFDRVQMRLEKNKRAPAMAKASDKFLLTTKLFCGKCGRMMAGESGTSRTGKTHYYYKCGSAKRKKGCDKKAVQKRWIEDFVVKYTLEMVMDDILMERLVDRLLELQGEESFDLRLLKKQLSETEKGIENMLNAIQMGIITASTKERLTSLEAQKAQLEESILREEIKRPVLTRGQITFFIHKFRKTDTSNEDERQRLIDCFVNSVFVYDDKIILTFNYKDGTKTISLDDVNGSDLVGFGPPKRRTHVANKRRMSPFPINNRKERIFDQKLQREQSVGAGLLVYRAIANRLFFVFRE